MVIFPSLALKPSYSTEERGRYLKEGANSNIILCCEQILWDQVET